MNNVSVTAAVNPDGTLQRVISTNDVCDLAHCMHKTVLYDLLKYGLRIWVFNKKQAWLKWSTLVWLLTVNC